MTKTQKRSLSIIIGAIAIFLIMMFAMAIDAFRTERATAQAGCNPGEVPKTFANSTMLIIYDDCVSEISTLMSQHVKIYTAGDGDTYTKILNDGTLEYLQSEIDRLTTEIATLEARKATKENQAGILSAELNKLPARQPDKQ